VMLKAMKGRFRHRREKVYKILTKAFAESNNMLFFETSAKNDIGIKELFHSIGKKLYG
jgi:hypothetical protein